MWSAEKLISALRFSDAIYFNWVHSALQHGCFNTEFDYFLEVATDDDQASYLDFAADWKFGSREFSAGATKCVETFQGKSITSHSRPSATDMLAFVTMVRCWCIIMAIASVSKSFLAMCDFISAPNGAKFNPSDIRRASLLDSLFEKWLTLFLLEHGYYFCIPKSHYLDHMGDLLRRFRKVFDTFVTERLNRRAKVAATDIDNTRAFERSVVISLLAYHMQSSACRDHIIGGEDVSQSCMFLGRSIRSGYLVRRKSSLSVGSVMGCIQKGDGIMLIVGVRSVARRRGAAATPFWVFIESQSHKCEKWTASHCTLALGWKEFPPDVLALSLA